MRFFVLGGTTEGRVIAERLATHADCTVVVSCATEYGGSLVPAAENVHVLEERLDEAGMERVLRDRRCGVVVDATHPYAVLASENARAAARAAGVRYLRVVRAEGDAGDARVEAPSVAAVNGSGRGDDNGADGYVVVPDVASAAKCVRAHKGRVLLTTGSKDLPAFVEAAPDFAERVYVRVLPVSASLAKTEELGIPASHVIAMQGPFSARLNEAVLREVGATLLVTKESGAAGGFAQKVEAACACGCEVLVISRPVHENGVSLAEALRELERMIAKGACGVGGHRDDEEREAQ